MRCTLDGHSLLTLWELCLAHPGVARGDALLRAVGDARASERPLGERNARLADLHARLFGPALDLVSRCPGCDAVAQFDGDCDVLAGAHGGDPAAPHRLDAAGYAVAFRLCTSEDVRAAAARGADDAFARALLLRCVVACEREGRACDPGELPVEVLDAVSRSMEALDPLASVSFTLRCPACDASWDARLDLGQCVWQKLQVAAERLLLDVDALARTYGWTESEVLGLSPTRRAAYVQMVAS